jgi:hypothetical protein
MSLAAILPKPSLDLTEKEKVEVIKGTSNVLAIVAGSAITQLITILQWNLEHLAVQKRYFDFQGQEITGTNPRNIERGYRGFTTSYSLQRITTLEATDVDTNNFNFTPLAPPLLSTAHRAADLVGDSAEAAAAIAESSLKSFNQGGLLGLLGRTLFGK